MQILSKYTGNKLIKTENLHTKLKLSFNDDAKIINKFDNELKINASEILLGFDGADLKQIKIIYDSILSKKNYDKTNSFLLALCIIIVSKITDNHYTKIVKEWL